MINRAIFLKALLICLLFCGFVGLPKVSLAQFIDLQLQIDPKITAQTERPLDFGTFNTNSGRQTIELGSPGMGIFSITGLQNQLILVTLDKPRELHHENPETGAVIPLQLFSRYGYSSQNHQDSHPLPEATGTIQMEPGSNPGPWNTVYIFMYGGIEISDIPEGTYSNQILLSVEYI